MHKQFFFFFFFGGGGGGGVYIGDHYKEIQLYKVIIK